MICIKTLKKSSKFSFGMAFLIGTALPPAALANSAGLHNDTILSGIIDLPRQAETAAIDGCAKVQTGLTIGGGFMLFTCEKLRPYYPISEHEIVAKRYHSALQEMGWRQAKTLDDGAEFTRRDTYGCTANLSVRVWKDRAINETILRKSREVYRQIVFTANYNGAACERYYPMVQAMKQHNNTNQFATR